jgi:Tol biopolymer transport system component
VAKALVQMGQCYEKLGRGEAITTYERVVREFGDQVESLATAQARLAALAKAGRTTNPSGVVVRQVWAGPDVDVDTLGTISPDGRYLSYVDWETGDLAIRDLTTGENRRLTSGPRGEFAFYSRISPDGRHVAYVWVDKANPYHLRVTGIDDLRAGVEPRVLHRDTNDYMAFGDWSPDGKSILANIRGIDLISVLDGKLTTLKTPTGLGRPQPRMSPDGRWIAYHSQPDRDSAGRDIFLLATDASRETQIEYPGNDFVLGWGPDGKRLLFASDRSGTLGAWVIAVEDGRPQGAPALVKQDIGTIVPLGFTRTGAFYYGQTTGLADVYLATLDPAAGRVATPPKPIDPELLGRASAPAWSPDGRFIAYLSNPRAGGSSFAGSRVIHVRSLETGQERELETELSFELLYRPRWSPDGRFLLVTSADRGRRRGLYRVDTQSGDVAPIVQGRPWGGHRPSGEWSADGQAVFYTYGDADSDPGGIRRRDLETGLEQDIYRGQANNLARSPDGRWLAFGVGGFADAGVLMVVPAEGGAPRAVLRLGDGEGRLSGIEWTADGRYLLFIKGSGGFYVPGLTPELWRVAVDGGQPQKVGLAAQNRGTLAIHPDGRQIAFTAEEKRGEVWVMENFLPPLKAAR